MSTSTRGVGRHWVYRCFDKGGRLIYVGCTTNLPNRLEQHRTSSWWAPTVVKVTSKVYPDGVTGRAAERQAIRDEVPRWNKASKWVGRSNWTQSDWHDWIAVLLRERLSPQLETSVRDYESLFGQALPERLAELYAAAQSAAAEAAARRDDQRLEQQRGYLLREAEEVRQLNEELSRILDRQAALAQALGIDWHDPDLMDATAAIDAALDQRRQA